MKMPKIRFKANDNTDYPDWNDNNLGELGSFYGGLSGKSKEDFVGGNCRYITYKNVYLNTFATPCSNDLVKIKPSEHQNKVKKFDVLFTQSSETFEEVGLSSIYLYDDEPYLNSFCKGFRFRNLDHICPEFIGYQLRSNKVRHAIMLMGQGISRINLRTEFLCKLTLSLPTLAEQHKIADLLLGVDAIIEKQQTEVATWVQYKKGLAQKLFDQEVRFKADDGSDFPDWECKKLSEVASMHARIGWQNLRQDEFLDSGDFMLITGTDFQDGLVNFKTCCYVDKWRYEQDQKIQVRNGTVLVTKDGTLGKVAIVKDLPKPATLNAGVFAINPLPMSALIPKYLYHWLRAPMLMNYAKAMSTGGTIKHLNQGILVNFEISVPCLEEQRKIAMRNEVLK